MALTFTAQTSEGTAAAVATLLTTLLGAGTGLFVAGYFDGRGVARSFMPAVMEQATAGDAVSKWFPQVGQASNIVSSPGTSDNAGPLKLYLTPEAADVILSSSILTVVLDRFVTVLTVTGTI